MPQEGPEPAHPLHETVVENLFDAVYYVDRKRTITYWNPAAERVTGFRAESVVGRRCSDGVLGHVDEHGRSLCASDCPLVHAMAQRRSVQAEVFLHRRDGRRLPVQVRCQPVRDPDGTVVGAVETFNDDSRRREQIERLREFERLASIDGLTGLPNRRAAELSLRTRLDQLEAAGWPLGVVLVDVDSFKQVNDEHGHRVGDDVLVAVGRCLAATLRESDVAARWGGEEFAIVTAASSREQILQLGERVRCAVAAERVPAGASRVAVTVSIGATLAVPGDTPTGLFERVDGALYRSKRAGGDRVSFAGHRPPAAAARAASGGSPPERAESEAARRARGAGEAGEVGPPGFEHTCKSRYL